MAQETNVKQIPKDEETEELANLPEELETEEVRQRASARRSRAEKLSLRKRRKTKRSLKRDSTPYHCQKPWLDHQKNVLHVPCNSSKFLSPST